MVKFVYVVAPSKDLLLEEVYLPLLLFLSKIEK